MSNHQRYVSRRFAHDSGPVSTFVYGPFSSHYYAEKFVERQMKSMTEEDRRRTEMVVHKPISVGQDD